MTMLAAPAAGEEPPDYIGLSTRADRFAIAVVSSKSCEHFGYTSSAALDLQHKGQQMIDEAVLAGMPAGSADLIFGSAIKAETERETARLADLKEHAGDSAVAEAFLTYWKARCAMLSRDPDYAEYFERP